MRERGNRGMRVCAQCERRMGKKERWEEVEKYKTTGLVAGDLLLSPDQQ